MTGIYPKEIQQFATLTEIVQHRGQNQPEQSAYTCLVDSDLKKHI